MSARPQGVRLTQKHIRKEQAIHFSDQNPLSKKFNCPRAYGQFFRRYCARKIDHTYQPLGWFCTHSILIK